MPDQYCQAKDHKLACGVILGQEILNIYHPYMILIIRLELDAKKIAKFFCSEIILIFIQLMITILRSLGALQVHK